MYAFPLCILSEAGDAFGLPLCYEDCVAVKLQFCYNEWALTEQRKEKGIYFKSREHFRLPNCSELPKYDPKVETCSHARLTEMKTEDITYDCIRDNGRFYQGTVNVTKTGKFFFLVENQCSF